MARLNATPSASQSGRLMRPASASARCTRPRDRRSPGRAPPPRRRPEAPAPPSPWPGGLGRIEDPSRVTPRDSVSLSASSAGPDRRGRRGKDEPAGQRDLDDALRLTPQARTDPESRSAPGRPRCSRRSCRSCRRWRASRPSSSRQRVLGASRQVVLADGLRHAWRLAGPQRVLLADDALQLGELADHAGGEIGLRQARGPASAARVRRRSPAAGTRPGPPSAPSSRAGFPAAPGRPSWPAAGSRRSGRSLQILAEVEVGVGQPRPDDALVAATDLRGIARPACWTRRRSSGSEASVRRLRGEAPLMTADGRLHHLARQVEEALGEQPTIAIGYSTRCMTVSSVASSTTARNPCCAARRLDLDAGSARGAVDVGEDRARS